MFKHLETAASFGDVRNPPNELLDLSMAISLKRIADYLERQERRLSRNLDKESWLSPARRNARPREFSP